MGIKNSLRYFGPPVSILTLKRFKKNHFSFLIECFNLLISIYFYTLFPLRIRICQRWIQYSYFAPHFLSPEEVGYCYKKKSNWIFMIIFVMFWIFSLDLKILTSFLNGCVSVYWTDPSFSRWWFCFTGKKFAYGKFHRNW